MQEHTRVVLQSLALFTAKAQQWIWERQNPDRATCGDQQFLLSSLDESAGLGMAVQVNATATVGFMP